MKISAITAERIAGTTIGLLGLAVSIRWIFQSKTIEALIPGSVQMGLTSPLLFMISAFCCFFALRRGPVLDKVWKAFKLILILFPALVLVQHIFGVNLGIDFVRVPTPPTPTNPHPGRMAPNTCIGFILAGIAFWLIRRRERTRAQQRLLTVCAALVAAIGFLALFGYFLQLQVMYRIASFNVMVPPTAFGMSMLGLGLWGLRGTLLDRGRESEIDYERRIIWRSLGIVALVAVSAGAAGFSAMRDSYEQSIADNTLMTASTSAAALGNTLDTSLWFSRNLATRSAVRERLLELQRDPANGSVRARMKAIGDSFFNANISAINFYDIDGRLVASSGTFVAPRATVRHPLANGGQTAQLLYEGSYVLYTETDVIEEGRKIGRIAAEQRMPLFDRLLADIRARSPSTDVLLCSVDKLDAYCAPSRFHPAPFRTSMARVDGGIDRPISLALRGKSGVMVTQDMRGIAVYAGYTPVRNYGLGVVIKSNVDTVYSPLRERTNVLVMVMVVLVLLGASTMWIQVRPLVARLVAEQRRTRVILDNSNDAFIALGPDGAVTDWNEAAERTFGWSAQEAIGRELADLIIPPAQRVPHMQGFRHFTRTGHAQVANQRLEVTALHRDGREIPIELSIAAYHNGEGYVANAFARDITERKRLAAEIEARATELEHERDRAQAANRAKGEFVANMSHELRTPMNAVLGMTYLLARTTLNDEQKKYLDMIRSSGQSLLGIMNDILDFSKVEAGRMQLAESTFHLGDVLGAVATIMSVNAGEKDLELAIGVDPALPQHLIGDPLRVQQVLVNLVGNAIKFTEHGEVAVTVGAAQPQAEGGIVLAISVRDTGIGISEEQLARLFSPFTQGDSSTTRRFGGTGLGLTISKHLTELMGGSISIDSEAGKGSTFRILLPMKVAEQQSDERRSSSALGRLRILVVDDNPTSRACLSDTISGWKWQADCASGGGKAIEMAVLAANNGQPYDAVLLDWQMPGMDGLSTARALRRLAPDGRQPLIMMVNAYGRGKLMNEPDAGQVDAFLSKPVTGSSLFDALHEVLVQRQRGGKRPPFPIATAPMRRLDGVRLLLAEDNELNQAVARGILEQVGARIDIVENGELAVERLAAGVDAYDMVLMDIQMPVMDGFEACRRIRGALGLKLPILAMTAGVTENERAACRACGMEDLIAKPVEVDEMLATIARHLPMSARTGGAPAPVEPAPVPAAAVPALPELDDLPVLRLEPLVNIARGNPAHLASVAKLVRRMIDDGGVQFTRAREQWAGGAPLDAAKTLHTLRGGVGSVGAKRFASVSLSLEQALKRDPADAADVEPLFEQAGIELEAALAAGRGWLDLNAPSAGAPSLP